MKTGIDEARPAARDRARGGRTRAGGAVDGAGVPRPADLPDLDPVPGHDVRRPLEHRLRREPRRLLRPLRRPGQRALLHAADRRRRRRSRRADRRRDDASRRSRPAVRAAQPRPGRAGADEGRHARDHVRGLREPADRPVGARVRARRAPARRAAGSVRLPAERRGHARRPPEPRLRERGDAAERPLPLHRDRERARPGRACRRRSPRAARRGSCATTCSAASSTGSTSTGRIRSPSRPCPQTSSRSTASSSCCR